MSDSESIDNLANQIREVFISPNEHDRNFEPANVVDGLFAIARGLHHVAEAIEQGRVTDGPTDSR